MQTIVITFGQLSVSQSLEKQNRDLCASSTQPNITVSQHCQLPQQMSPLSSSIDLFCNTRIVVWSFCQFLLSRRVGSARDLTYTDYPSPQIAMANSRRHGQVRAVSGHHGMEWNGIDYCCRNSAKFKWYHRTVYRSKIDRMDYREHS